jgi:hypothetical protein
VKRKGNEKGTFRRSSFPQGLQQHRGIVAGAIAVELENRDALPDVGVFDGTFRGLHLVLLDRVGEPEVVGCSHESGKR